MNQEALGRVAGLEAPGSEAAPPARPLRLRRRRRPGPRFGVRGRSRRQRGRQRLLRGRGGPRTLRLRTGGDAARGVGAEAEESRVLNADAAGLHGRDGVAPLPGV